MSKPIRRSVADPARPRAVRSAAASVAVSDARSSRVSDALAMAAGVGVVEIYVGWALEPIHVATGSRRRDEHNWEHAGPVLRERVSRAIQPLLDAGWRLDGSAVSAMRWDTSSAIGGQAYDGCWVRMRARPA
jgi:hypothetical protein